MKNPKNGSAGMRRRGLFQVSVYLTREQLRALDRKANAQRRKRAAMALNFILDGLEKTCAE